MLISDIALFVLKRDVKLQPTNLPPMRPTLHSWFRGSDRDRKYEKEKKEDKERDF